jgi:hypothetical protein
MHSGLRRLSERLRHAAHVSASARLAPAEVNIALMALRSAIESAQVRRDGRGDSFQIELLDDDGWPIEVLAVVNDEPLARAVFARALTDGPKRRMRLRIGGHGRRAAQTPASVGSRE